MSPFLPFPKEGGLREGGLNPSLALVQTLPPPGPPLPFSLLLALQGRTASAQLC